MFQQLGAGFGKSDAPRALSLFLLLPIRYLHTPQRSTAAHQLSAASSHLGVNLNSYSQLRHCDLSPHPFPSKLRRTHMLRATRPLYKHAPSAALRERVARASYLDKLASPEDLIQSGMFFNGAALGWSGFTGVSYPKVVSGALAVSTSLVQEGSVVEPHVRSLTFGLSRCCRITLRRTICR